MLGGTAPCPGLPVTALAATLLWLLITVLFILQRVLVGVINHTVTVLGWALPEAEPETRIWVVGWGKVYLGGSEAARRE